MTLEDIARISEEANAALRNLRITQCYHDLSAELARAVDAGNANWCTFATWASKTAGNSIRDEELPRVLVDLLRDEARLRPKVGPVFLWIYRRTVAKVDLFAQGRATLQRVSEEVAEGNRKVFTELAPLFVRFASLMAAPAADRAASLPGFVTELRPGPTGRGGQELLQRAFSNYATAAGEPDARKKAQLMLLANCQIGLHEQTRLQNDIKGAMDAPVGAVVTDGLGRLLVIKLAFALLGPFGVSRERVRAAIQDEWQHVVTRFSMTLSLPGGRVLPLGGDSIPWPSQIPEALRTPTNPDLIALLQQFDDDTERLRTRGADNWARLGDRMGFICELFRSAQQSADLFDQPFSQAARDEIARGVVPRGGI